MGARRARSGAGLVAPRLLSEVSQAGAGSPARVEPGGTQIPAGLEARQEISMARAIRAHCLASGQSAAQIALIIHSQCSPAFGTTLVRAHRLALGIALADVVAQVRARYVREGRTPPRFSETLLSSYEGGQKRPGPEYLHYLCCVYQAEPADLGYEGPCLCRQGHRAPPLVPSGPVLAGPPDPGRADGPGLHGHDLPGAPRSTPPILTAVPGGGEPGPAEPGGRTAGGPVGLTATQLPAPEPGGAARLAAASPAAATGPARSASVLAASALPASATVPASALPASALPASALPAWPCLPQPRSPSRPCLPRPRPPPQRRCRVPSRRRRPGPQRPGLFPGRPSRAPRRPPTPPR